MQDDNWELINGQDAHDIEVLNYSTQINVIEAYFRLVVHHKAKAADGLIFCPNSVVLRQLHSAGTLFLLEAPGSYRAGQVHVVNEHGQTVHEPPSADKVEELMAEFDRELFGMWAEGTPIQLAAFALWRINWIHPFKNGNGRTARAFAYVCLCLKFGLMLPGTTTVIDLITRSRPQYYAALRVADQAFAATGKADLMKMEEYLENLAVEQLHSAPGTADKVEAEPVVEVS